MNNKRFYIENGEILDCGFFLGSKEQYVDVMNKQDQRIVELEQELIEKDKEIKKLNWQLKDKDFIIKNLNHSLSVAPNANAGQRARIDELTKIVKEKDKEIESLKKADNIWLDSYQNELDTLRQNQTQLAIQELEKVKNKCNGMYELWLDSNYKENMYNNEDIAGVFEDISVFTNDLIKKLKGE